MPGGGWMPRSGHMRGMCSCQASRSPSMNVFGPPSSRTLRAQDAAARQHRKVLDDNGFKKRCHQLVGRHALLLQAVDVAFGEHAAFSGDVVQRKSAIALAAQALLRNGQLGAQLVDESRRFRPRTYRSWWRCVCAIARRTAAQGKGFSRPGRRVRSRTAPPGSTARWRARPRSLPEQTGRRWRARGPRRLNLSAALLHDGARSRDRLRSVAESREPCGPDVSRGAGSRARECGPHRRASPPLLRWWSRHPVRSAEPFRSSSPFALTRRRGERIAPPFPPRLCVAANDRTGVAALGGSSRTHVHARP